MKRIYWIPAVLLAIGIVSLVVHMKGRDTQVQEDGGTRHFVDENAPKVIRSEEITFFHCEFSTTDRLLEDTPIAGNVITLKADAENASYDLWGLAEENNKGSFLTDALFFQKLQQIVSKYDFAQYNGQHYKVSGLPPNLGMELEIGYASGESIRSSNNQSCILPLEAMEALVALFQQYES